MSTRSKGMQYEIEFEKLLINLGYKTQRVKGGTRWGKNTDFWDYWDIISFDNKGWLLVQVKTDYRKKVYEELTEWFDTNMPPECTAVYAIRKKGKKGVGKWKIKYVGNNRNTPLVLPSETLTPK